MAEMPTPAPHPKPRQRDWFSKDKADAFIKAFWAFADAQDSDTRKLLKLLLITGKRRGVVQTMCWEAIDADWLWTPPEGSANKRNNPITLPRLARRVLGKRGSGCVFSEPIADGEMDALIAAVKKAVEPTYFHHGLRHVMATKLSELKVAPHVARLVMDHAPIRDAHSGYEHVDWAPEIAEVLETWCNYLERLVRH